MFSLILMSQEIMVNTSALLATALEHGGTSAQVKSSWDSSPAQLQRAQCKQEVINNTVSHSEGWIEFKLVD